MAKNKAGNVRKGGPKVKKDGKDDWPVVRQRIGPGGPAMQQDLKPLGVAAYSIWPDPSPIGKPSRVHQHTDIEIIVYEHGATTMFYGGRTVRIPPDRLAIFWGAMPHQALESGPQVVAHVLHVPLAVVLSWPLPAWFVHQLTHFDVLLESPRSAPCSDLDLLKHWVKLAGRRTTEAERIVLLEVEARLCRMALDRHATSVVAPRPPGVGRLERMVDAIARRCLEPVSISEVAREADLTRAYATRLFHREIGVTMLEYITRQRVSHAQRLLATTERGVLDVLNECGFRSPTRFYAVFARFVGCTPGLYRRRLRAGVPPALRTRAPAGGAKNSRRSPKPAAKARLRRSGGRAGNASALHPT
jgi:AraC-like DNA-binding protein